MFNRAFCRVCEINPEHLVVGRGSPDVIAAFSKVYKYTSNMLTRRVATSYYFRHCWI